MAKSDVTDRHLRAWIRGERILPTAVPTVFRMPGAPVTWKQNLWVAVLAGPPSTVVSHASAAALRGLSPPPATPHVTVPRTASGRFRGAIVHHSVVQAPDRCRFEGVPSTGVARTIVDCAALLDQEGLDALVDAAFGRGLSIYRRVETAWARAGHVRGGALLAAALAPFTGNVRLNSEMEAHLLRRFHEWAVPPPQCQYTIRDEGGRFLGRVDFGWPEWRFGLEYLGDEFHSPRKWALDARRLEAIRATGWRIELSDRGDFRPSSLRLPNLLLTVFGLSAA